VTSIASLTMQEREILELTATLYNLYVALPNRHPSDLPDMARDIHDIQHRGFFWQEKP
jgi:hypothetical protein